MIKTETKMINFLKMQDKFIKNVTLELDVEL